MPVLLPLDPENCMAAECKIIPCTCSHEYQDSRYGKGNRVHNPRIKDGKLRGWCCTVCAGVKEVSYAKN